MKQAILAWRGEDDAARFDRATVRFDDRGMVAHGTSITDAYALSWSLDATDHWRTRTLGVTVYGDGWWRSIALTRSSAATWSAEANMHGDVDLPDAGLADLRTIESALDCDLGLCPVTNTMPIRRLRLRDGNVNDTQLVVAWVEVPSLRVLRSDQVYRAAGAGRAGFRSGDFSAEITYDDDGFVLDYPSLARRIPSS